MNTIKVFTIIGTNCVSLEDGQRIYELVKSSLAHGVPVELDFNDVNIYASPFFNAALGQLLKDIDAKTLNTNLKISNLSPDGLETIRKVIDNSREYYLSAKKRQDVDQSVDSIDE
jgi:STAS-like domain of unknown function (DUF4325)